MDNTQRDNMKAFSNLLNEDKDIKFLNHGYFPINSRIKKDSLFNTCASLYVNLFEKYLPNFYSDETVLDIGCGRGGGIEILKDIFDLKNIYGCDFNENNIAFCKKNTDAYFRVCDAIDLNYPVNFFNCVINIESSNCYTDIDRFFAEVNKVLKPGGNFLYADIFKDINHVERYINKIINAGFEIIDINDITYNTYLSCIHIDKMIDQHIIKNNIASGPYIVLKNLYANKANAYKHRSNLFFTFRLKSNS
jgi:ubiquinone/menaquinone biosynthesis C-methylase UbiE